MRWFIPLPSADAAENLAMLEPPQPFLAGSRHAAAEVVAQPLRQRSPHEP